MVWLWVTNALLCLMFFALSIDAWRQRAQAFAILNMTGGLLIGGLEALDLFGGASKPAIVVVTVPLGLIFLADLFLVLRDMLPHKRPVSTAHRQVNPGVPEFFVIQDEARFRDELKGKQRGRGYGHERALQLCKRGNAAFARADYQRAQQHYDRAAQHAPFAVCLCNYAATLLAQQLYEAALTKCEAALQIDQANYEAWMNRGVAFLMLEQPREAIECFERGTPLQPSSDIPHLCKAHALRKLARWQAAVEACDAALRIDAEKPETWHLKAVCLNHLARDTEARTCFDKAIALQPDHYQAYVHRGNLLLKRGQYAEAVESYNQALRLRPDCLEALNNRGIALGKTGNLSDALRSYEKAVQLNDSYYEAWLNLGVAHDIRSETVTALDSYRKFLHLAPARMHKHIAIIRERVDELSRRSPETEKTTPPPCQMAMPQAPVK